MNKPDLSEFFALIAEEKKKAADELALKEEKKAEKSRKLKEEFLELISVPSEKVEVAEEVVQIKELVEKVVEEIVEEVAEPTLQEKSVQYITAEAPAEKTVINEAVVFQKQIDNLKSHINQLALGMQGMGGGGEVNLRWLDDVDRSSIADGRWLKYNGTTGKFEFDEINPYEVVYNTTLVDEATYTVEDTDYYLGVDYAGPVTITLPVSASSGRVLVIKDESGDASTNPITVSGTIDNDSGGFILKLNNGGVQMIYRSGWRII
jgi:hypothetical protein